MEIRQLTPDEISAAEMLESLSFVFPLADEQQKKLEENSYKPDHWGTFDENGKLTATLTNHDLPIYLDGNIAPARGVGGVASDPVSRGQGHVRALFKQLLEADRAAGVLVSALYPFSHAFYRKFGYELCYQHQTANFPTEELKVFRSEQPPQARLLTPKDDMAALMPLYTAFAKQYSFMAARSERSWARFEISNPRKAERYWYVLSRDGKDTAYVIFSYRAGAAQFERTLCVRDYAFLDKQGFFDLMSFLYRFAAQAKDTEMFIPDNLPLSSLVENAYAVKLTAANRPMARVLHVENVLKAMRHPQEDGEYSVYVEDSFLPENTGCYAVRYSENGEVSVAHSDEEADLRVSVQTFTQLAFGFLDLEEAAYKPDVLVAGNEEILKKVFAKKLLFLGDFY